MGVFLEIGITLNQTKDSLRSNVVYIKIEEEVVVTNHLKMTWIHDAIGNYIQHFDMSKIHSIVLRNCVSRLKLTYAQHS